MRSNLEKTTLPSTKTKEITTMFYYQIRNKMTQERFETIAPNFTKACKARGWKPYHCKIIWKASPENASNPENF